MDYVKIEVKNMNAKMIGMVLLVVALLFAIYVAADFTLKTSSGDVKLFGQGQTTYGVGISKYLNQLRSKIVIIGSSSTVFETDQTDSSSAVLLSPSGAGSSSSFVALGKSMSGGNYGQVELTHNGANGVIATYKVGTGIAGDIIIDSYDGIVYIGADKTVGNSKDLKAKNVFTDNGTCGSWDVAGDVNYDTDLLREITDNNGVWDLSKIVKKNSTGHIIQSVLKTELVPETVEVFDETVNMTTRVPTGRMVDSTWLDIGQLNGYLIGVVKAQQEVIDDLTARVETIESKCG